MVRDSLNGCTGMDSGQEAQARMCKQTDGRRTECKDTEEDTGRY